MRCRFAQLLRGGEAEEQAEREDGVGDEDGDEAGARAGAVANSDSRLRSENSPLPVSVLSVYLFARRCLFCKPYRGVYAAGPLMNDATAIIVITVTT